MKIEKIIELLDKHNETGISIRRLTNDKYTEHQLLEELLGWAKGAIQCERGLSWLTQTIYERERFYGKEWDKNHCDSYFFKGMSLQTLINDMEHELPWVREEDYLDEVGGFHSPGQCYNPEGHFCGECNKESCKGCAYEEVDEWEY